VPKIKGKVLDTSINQDGWFIAKIRLNGKLPPKDSIVTVKWGSIRSIPQNNLYFAFLHWCIEHGGLKEMGHYSVYALHLDCKAHFLAEKIYTKEDFEIIEEATTTILDKVEFSEYMEKVDYLMNNILNVNTAPFWEEHKRNYAI